MFENLEVCNNRNRKGESVQKKEMNNFKLNMEEDEIDEEEDEDDEEYLEEEEIEEIEEEEDEQSKVDDKIDQEKSVGEEYLVEKKVKK